MVRVAVLNTDRCKPKECGLPCMNYCPQNRMRVNAIEFNPKEHEHPLIIEEMCPGCGICIKKCPFGALSIVNLPDELEEECSHRYGVNAFKLYRLPIPTVGKLTGLIGRNGVGKTTSLRILAGEIKPNLGNIENPPGWDEVSRRFRGSVLQEYFQRLSKGDLRTVYKPQHVDAIPRAVSGIVGDVLDHVDERGKKEWAIATLQLRKVLDREIGVLSGGELQRVAIAAALLRDVDVYFFDEPSSYLDVFQRINVARAIRSLIAEEKMVLVSEHDLAVLDYLSDHTCVLYGEPDVYGIVSHVHGVRVGINIYIEGFIPDENMRIRKKPITFHVKPPTKPAKFPVLLEWDEVSKSYDGFKLSIEAGRIGEGEVMGIVGPNGIGKTTFMKVLAGIEEPDEGMIRKGEMKMSYKPQYLRVAYRGSVKSLLRKAAGRRFRTKKYKSEIIEPLNLQKALEKDITELSGGELQRAAIAECLSRDATVYLLDEPSAYLDVEERLAVAKAIRGITRTGGRAAFVVEHDIVAMDFIADRLMVFMGEPGLHGVASSPVDLRDGMNRFLRDMEVTFRRDAETKRPRVNKEGSKLDRDQKSSGEYYYVG
ncbi:MAG: ribosome biogenesis/translation initiation ATPase RLI [Candidatus Bathyarchaeia archaeon]